MEGSADYVFIRPLAQGNHGQYCDATPPARLPTSRSRRVSMRCPFPRETFLQREGPE